MPRTTIFVLSDHGFKTVKRQIRPNAALMKAGLLKVAGREGHAGARPTLCRKVARALVYVTVPDPSGDDPEPDETGARRAWRASTQ